MEQLTAVQILILLSLLEIKHWFGDGPFQTYWMVTEKGHYGRPGGLVHAGIHGAGDIVVLAAFGLPLTVVLILSAVECVLHYHVDFIKEMITRRMGFTTHDRGFWLLNTADQAIHRFIYFGMVLALVSWH